MKRILGLIGCGLLLFAAGVGVGYWTVPALLASVAHPPAQNASVPAGNVPLGDAATSGDTTAANTATATPSSAPASFQTIVLSGHGQQATKVFTLPAGGYRITMTHDGLGNFIVILADNQGKSIGTLANQVGKANVSQVINASGGSYVCNVGADGNWTIKIEAL
jgi:hypothetical protein